VAASILREAHIECLVCADLSELTWQITRGSGIAILTEEAMNGCDSRDLSQWIAAQQPWSDFPFILLTGHGGGLERNPAAAHFVQILGNVTFLERPFHPTTLISVVQTGLRGRQRQYECRRLNEELESRVQERTGELAAANRQLLAQIEEREKVEGTLRRMQRLEAVGQLTSGVAHDFNNLLTVVLGNITFLERGLAAVSVDGKLAQRLGYMRSAAERGARLTDQLLSFSRRQRLEPRPLNLNDIVDGMHALLQSTMGGSIDIVIRLQPELWPAMVDPTQLELAVLNLAINARDAMEVGGTLTVETANAVLGQPTGPEEPPEGSYVVVRVTDNGAGMTDEVRQKVFEPFFTTKEVGKGSGLGLSQVLGFAQQSGGGVGITSRPSEGTAVFIYLPRTEQRAAREQPVTVSPAASELIGASILLIDDDNGVREVTATMLRDLGYQVYEAGSGGAALDLLEREPAIDLLLVDFAMPGMSGADVARRAQSLRPALPAVFITGYADHRALGEVSESHIIGKPFQPHELAQKVRAALVGSELAAQPAAGPQGGVARQMSELRARIDRLKSRRRGRN
jgi:signal transduction histidine kinase/DNA-binding NarL/FixJ family response regulator